MEAIQFKIHNKQASFVDEVSIDLCVVAGDAVVDAELALDIMVLVPDVPEVKGQVINPSVWKAVFHSLKDLKSLARSFGCAVKVEKRNSETL